MANMRVDQKERGRPMWKGKAYWQGMLAPFRTRNGPREQLFRLRTARVKRIAINLFLGFHILAITCWCVPLNIPLFPLCRKLIRPYFLWAGLFQSWDMFAPMPWGSNSDVEAVVIYKDGSRTTWSFPRMEQLGRTERYSKERYRKFSEVLQIDDNDALWPDVARRIARLCSTPSKPVKTVILIRWWSPIVPRADGSYEPEPWDRHVLLGYGVRPEDLQ